jgi:phosphoglucosamine mutase
MFGTSGIRGVYGAEITPALAMRVAGIFSLRKLAVGRDIRESGPALLGAVCAGAAAAGADVVDLGIVPTPTVALATKMLGCRGIMITASHNPPEYNGLKLIEAGKEIGKGLEREITQRYRSNESVGTSNARKAAAIARDGDVIEEHKRLVTGLVDTKAIAKRRPTVVVDCNGAASAITPGLLSDLGCRVISVNASPYCFNRPSEPNAANLAYLPEFVVSSGADFAIAHDGDGDRCVVLDEKGGVLPLDAQLAIMIEHELGRQMDGERKIVTTVESSLSIRDVVKSAGGEMVVTPVGSTFVGDALEAEGALFGGEPCGEYIYRDGVHVPDAVLAAAKFAEIFCKEGAFSKLKARYPQNPIAREKHPCTDKRKAMDGIVRDVRKLGIAGAEWNDDGLRIDEKDGWFLIRASGTEPIVRLTMEYKGREKLLKRKKEIESIIKANCAITAK